MKKLFPLGVIALFFCAPIYIFGCSCARVGDDRPCGNFAGTPAIFVGRPISVETVKTKIAEDSRLDWTQNVFRFAVSEFFKGPSGPSIDVITGQGGGDCGYNFEIGKSYLVYAYSDKDGRLSTGICTRTREVDQAEGDLQFLRSLSSAKPVGLLYGNVSQYIPRRANTEWKPMPLLPGVSVELTGEGGAFKTVTDGEGKYSFADLAPGNYSLTIFAPDGLWPLKDERKFTIAAKACASYSASFSKRSGVSGRLLDETGAPVAKRSVGIVPEDEIEGDRQRDVRWAETKEDGTFEFEGLAPGRYYLGYRIDRISERDSPYPPTYFPGVTDVASAAAVEVIEGRFLDKLDFQLAPPMREREIRGKVVFRDGKPARDANICLRDEFSAIANCLAKEPFVRSNGEFAITVREGLKYQIRAYINHADGHQEHAEPIDIPAIGTVKNLKIVISEPNGSCSKCIKLIN